VSELSKATNDNISSLSNSRNNHHFDASSEHLRTVVLQALLQIYMMTFPNACDPVFHVTAV